MTIKRKQFVKVPFLEGKSGDEVADDAQRILMEKPESHSAVAITGTLAVLWDEKAAQAKANIANAARPRKKIDVTAEAIEKALKGYVAQYGSERGFWSYAVGAFDLDEKTLRARMKKKTRE